MAEDATIDAVVTYGHAEYLPPFFAKGFEGELLDKTGTRQEGDPE